MDNSNDLDPELMFQKISEIFQNNEIEPEEEEKEKEFFFTNEELEEKFRKRITADLINIKKTANRKNLQAFCSAAIKNYKRDLITLHINKIKKKEGLKLTTRAADLFFMSYLGRSVGEKYLCANFGGDYNKKDIILTPEYRKELMGIIGKYKEETQEKLYYVIAFYHTLKAKIIYAS